MHSAIIFVKEDSYNNSGRCCFPPSLLESYARGEILRIDVRIKETDELIRKYYGYGLKKFIAEAVLSEERIFGGNKTYLTKIIDPKDND